jgi:hypothetical protein
MSISKRRFLRRKHIIRKKKIAKHIFGTEYFNHDGKFDKAHLGCSCGMCKPTKGLCPTEKQQRENYINNLKIKEYFEELN